MLLTKEPLHWIKASLCNVGAEDQKQQIRGEEAEAPGDLGKGSLPPRAHFLPDQPALSLLTSPRSPLDIYSNQATQIIPSCS